MWNLTYISQVTGGPATSSSAWTSHGDLENFLTGMTRFKSDSDVVAVFELTDFPDRWRLSKCCRWADEMSFMSLLGMELAAGYFWPLVAICRLSNNDDGDDDGDWWECICWLQFSEMVIGGVWITDLFPIDIMAVSIGGTCSVVPRFPFSEPLYT